MARPLLVVCTVALTATMVPACDGATPEGAGAGASGGTSLAALSAGAGGIGAAGAGDAGGGSGSGPAGASGSAGAAGGSADCAEKLVPPNALLLDFENYDGVSEPLAFDFGFLMPDQTTYFYAGFWAHTDEVPVADYELGMVAGANESEYAARAADPSADTWGGGLGMYLHCLDASSFSGVEFYLRGSAPLGTVTVSMGLEGDVSVSAANLTLSADWTLLQVPWADFSGDAQNSGASTDGSAITSLTVNADLEWMLDPDAASETWIPNPAPYELEIDDVGFY